MKEAVDVLIREAVPDDAEELLAVTKQIGSETDFLIMDEAGLAMDAIDLSYHLERIFESDNNILFITTIDEKIVGTASIKAESNQRICHIGEIGISILETYWGFGLGTLMLEELVEWAKENPKIRRLELTVQERNQRAIHLYQKFGFQTEGILARGVKSEQGEFLDVRLMSLLID